VKLENQLRMSAESVVCILRIHSPYTYTILSIKSSFILAPQAISHVAFMLRAWRPSVCL